MEQPVTAPRRRSDGSVRESLFFPVLEQNKQQRLESIGQGVPELIEGRPKRWTWGGSCNPLEGTYEQSLPPDLEVLPCVIDESVPCSPQRSAYQRSLSHTEDQMSSTESPSVTLDFAKHSQTELLTGEKPSVCLLVSSPVRRSESPATPTRRSSARAPSQGPPTPRRVKSSVRRGQSPCPGGLYPPSPLKNGPSSNGTENRKQEVEEKGTRIHTSAERKSSRTETPERKIPKPTNRETTGDASPATPTGKPVAGTTDAEEASRILAERRRQARLQKELEERQRREREEEERLRQEELRRQQENEARQLEEKRQREERERRDAMEEVRRHREQRWRELQAQLEREKEEVEVRAQQEAERLRQDREMLKLQEEQERLQRKKRIEEIMKRTRKTDTETKKAAVWVEPLCTVSLPQSVSSSLQGLRAGTGQVNMQINDQISGRSFGQLGQPMSCLIGQGLLGADDLADEVQAMDVSPVSKEELVPVSEFASVNEIQNKRRSNGQVMENLLDLTGFVSNPKLASGASLGDCNKNLIEGFCPCADSKTIQTVAQMSDNLGLQ